MATALSSVWLCVSYATQTAASADRDLKYRLDTALAAFRAGGGHVEPRWNKLVVTHLLARDPAIVPKPDVEFGAAFLSQAVSIVTLAWLERVAVDGSIDGVVMADPQLVLKDKSERAKKLRRWMANFSDWTLSPAFDPDEHSTPRTPQQLERLAEGDTVMVRVARGPYELTRRREISAKRARRAEEEAAEEQKEEKKEEEEEEEEAESESEEAESESEEELADVVAAFVRLEKRCSVASGGDTEQEWEGVVLNDTSVAGCITGCPVRVQPAQHVRFITPLFVLVPQQQPPRAHVSPGTMVCLDAKQLKLNGEWLTSRMVVNVLEVSASDGVGADSEEVRYVGQQACDYDLLGVCAADYVEFSRSHVVREEAEAEREAKVGSSVE